MRVPCALYGIVVTGMMSAAFQPAARAAAADPSLLVTELAAQLGQALGDRSLSRIEQQQRFRALLDEDFDFPVISRFVLGRHWQGSSDAFHLEFAGVFEDYVIGSLSRRFADYGGETIHVTATRVESEHSTVVSTTIVHRDGASQANVDWRVQSTPSGFRIADVSVAGVSMAITYREQVAAVIDHDGGQVTSLISTLRQKLDNDAASSGNVPANVSVR
jgi:phospholipid transport system substrate-binding protein